MLKVGLIGVGGISKAHISAWKGMSDAELVAICDIRPERLEKYPEIRHYSCFEDMAANEKLDIIDICLPTYIHAEYAIKALSLGYNVVCEKPISMNIEDVDRIYNTAKEHNVKFMVAQVLRFWPEYELVKELYDTGKYGKLLSGTMSRIGAFPKWSWDGWMGDESRSGFVPYDLHVHDLDFIIYAFGQPKSASGFRSKLPDQDYVNMTYNFGDFSIATEASWYAARHPFGAHFRFQFEDAVVTNESKALKIYLRDGTVIDFSAEEAGDTGDIQLPKSNAYANELRYFADCVKNNIQPAKVQPEQLKTVINIIDTYIKK